MVEFQNISPRPLPREARGYRDEDDFWRDAAALVIAVRLARVAWEAGPCHPGEWHAFAQALRSGARAGATVPKLIEEARSWAAGWWRRAHFVNQRWR